MNDSDRELVEKLIETTGLSASAIAARAGLTPSTLTRPLKEQRVFSLSKATLQKLRDTFPRQFGSDYSQRDYLPVEILPSFAGMGGGGTGDGDNDLGMIPRHLIEDELRGKPEDMLLIDVRGDSMEPDFKHGDQILIDRRDQNLAQPGPFAIWDGDGYVVKIVERVADNRDQLRVFSANDRYSPYIVMAEEFQIMGRPVWIARRL